MRLPSLNFRAWNVLTSKVTVPNIESSAGTLAGPHSRKECFPTRPRFANIASMVVGSDPRTVAGLPRARCRSVAIACPHDDEPTQRPKLFASCTATLVCTILMLAHGATVSLPCTGTTYPRPICLARDAAVSLLPCSTWLPRQTRNHVSSRFYHSGPHFTHQHTDHDVVNHRGMHSTYSCMCVLDWVWGMGNGDK